VKRVHQSLMALAAIGLLFSFLVYLVYTANLVQFPFDYDQGEGFELVDTVLFSQFKLPYLNTEKFPFYSSNYPPVYHIIAAPFVPIFGPQYWYGRLLSFLSTLVTAGAIAYAVYREQPNRSIALFAGLAFLSSNTVYHIGPLFRQHIVMVMFETLAIVILAYAFPRRSWRGLILGAILLIAAGYTKQLAAITAVSILVWMFVRQPRRAILWGLGFAAGGALIFILLNVASSGEWWRQAIVANAGKIDPLQVFGLFNLWWRLHGFLIILAVIFVVYETYIGRWSLYTIWFLAAAGLGGAASGTWGGGDSYFSTSIAALCLLSGIAAARFVNQGWTFTPRWSKPIERFLQNQRVHAVVLIVIPLLYLGYARATLKMPTDGPVFGPLAQILGVNATYEGRFFDSATYDVGGYAHIGHMVTPQDTAAGWQIVDLMRQTEGLVLSEEAGFVLAAGRQVITNPTQLKNLETAGLFKGTELIEMLENREFGLLVMRGQLYPSEVLRAMGTHYDWTDTILMNGFEYQIWYPKSATRSRDGLPHTQP